MHAVLSRHTSALKVSDFSMHPKTVCLLGFKPFDFSAHDVVLCLCLGGGVPEG